MSGKFDVEVEIHMPISNGYRIKVNIPVLGIYSSGWRITHTDKNESGWWVQPPSYKDGAGNWHNAIEFNKREELWTEIELASIEVANFEDKISRSTQPPIDKRDMVATEILSDEDFELMLDESFASPANSEKDSPNV